MSNVSIRKQIEKTLYEKHFKFLRNLVTGLELKIKDLENRLIKLEAIGEEIPHQTVSRFISGAKEITTE